MFNPFFGSMAFDAPLRFALAVGLTFALSWLSYHFFEKQFLALKSRFESTGEEPRPVVPDRKRERQLGDEPGVLMGSG